MGQFLFPDGFYFISCHILLHFTRDIFNFDQKEHNDFNSKLIGIIY